MDGAAIPFRLLTEGSKQANSPLDGLEKLAAGARARYVRRSWENQLRQNGVSVTPNLKRTLDLHAKKLVRDPNHVPKPSMGGKDVLLQTPSKARPDLLTATRDAVDRMLQSPLPINVARGKGKD